VFEYKFNWKLRKTVSKIKRLITKKQGVARASVLQKTKRIFEDYFGYLLTLAIMNTILKNSKLKVPEEEILLYLWNQDPIILITFFKRAH
jgi:hypothetical protein